MTPFSGHLALRAATREHGRTVLAAQSFRAPFHLSKPYWDVEAGVLLAQVVNPTAGILAGDRLESQIAVESGAALCVTTPSASRVFKMAAGEAAECRQAFSVAAGGWLEVSPEPLVPHRGSCYRQVTTIEVARGGALFFVDQLQPGRVGHGEAWQWERLALELTVRLDGESILRERLDQSGEALRALAELAGSGASACFANAVLIDPAAAGEMAPCPWREALAALHGDGLWLGVSALRRGGWSLKLVGRDAVRLRQALREAREILAVYFPRLRCDPRKL
ncbi:MAG TPA: urease accessory protein UreD [Opitutaceae bacterium]|nr:urease accessory protein UreD [Opitutaceae bacterium]